MNGRIAAVAAVLASQFACMNLDSMVIPNHETDGYDLTSKVIPESAVEWVQFSAPDGQQLTGAWLRQPNPSPPMLWFHGNGGPIDYYKARLEYLYGWGLYDIFVWDYRGFGTSKGPPTRDGVLEQDGLAAVEYVIKETGYAAEEIPWLGLSLGASVAVHTNDEIDAQVVVLESMFASSDALVDDGTGLDLPTGWFFEAPYDNVAEAPHMRAPVLVVHGMEDDFVDRDYALDIYDALPEPKELWRPDGVDHADIHDAAPDAFRERVLGFIAKYGG